MANREVIYSTCKSCHGGCGVKVTKEDGVVVHIEGNPDSLTGGTMCSKGLSSIQHIDNPYRIKYPMKQGRRQGRGQVEADLLGRGAGHHRGQDEGRHQAIRVRKASPSPRARAGATTATPCAWRAPSAPATPSRPATSATVPASASTPW